MNENRIYNQNVQNLYVVDISTTAYVGDIYPDNAVRLPKGTHFSFMEYYAAEDDDTKPYSRLRVHAENYGDVPRPYPVVMIPCSDLVYAPAEWLFPEDISMGTPYWHPIFGKCVEDLDGWRQIMPPEKMFMSVDGTAVNVFSLPEHSPFAILWGVVDHTQQYYLEVVAKCLLPNPADDDITAGLKQWWGTPSIGEVMPLTDNPMLFDTFSTVEALLAEIGGMTGVRISKSELYSQSINTSP